METLKAELIEPPVLALPRLQGEYTADKDACDEQIGGCILLQKRQDGTDRTIGTGHIC